MICLPSRAFFLTTARQPTNNTANNTKSLCYSATEFQLSDIFSPPNRMHSKMSFALVGFAQTRDAEGGSFDDAPRLQCPSSSPSPDSRDDQIKL